MPIDGQLHQLPESTVKEREKNVLKLTTYQKAQVLQSKIRGTIQMVNQTARGANKDVNLAGPSEQAEETDVSKFS